eukprot:scaffold6992_cov151-Skeletonema_menzelii.AAC.2
MLQGVEAILVSTLLLPCDTMTLSITTMSKDADTYDRHVLDSFGTKNRIAAVISSSLACVQPPQQVWQQDHQLGQLAAQLKKGAKRANKGAPDHNPPGRSLLGIEMCILICPSFN